MTEAPAPPLSCSQCGAPLPAPEEAAGGAAVRTCEYCGTVVVTRGGKSRIAGRVAKTEREAHVEWQEALCCRLCGGALPASVVATPEKTRCTYCGHRALLRPSVLAALRLALTKPKLAPPTLRRALLYNIAFVLLAIGITVVGIWRHDGTTRYYESQTDIEKLRPGDEIARWSGDVPAFTKSFGFRVKAREFGGGAFSLRVTYQHVESGTCQTQTVNVYLGKSTSGFASRRAKISWGVPPGAFRAEIVVNSIKDTPSGKLEIILSGNQAFSVGWLAFFLNALLWLTFLNVRSGVDFTALRHRGATVTKIVTAAFLVFWFSFAVLGLDPLAKRSIDQHGRTDCPASLLEN